MVRLTESTVFFNRLAYEFDSTAEAAEFKKRIEEGGDPAHYVDTLKCIEIYTVSGKNNEQ